MSHGVQELMAKLKPEHVIRVMLGEHEVVLGFLDELERANHAFQAASDRQAAQESLRTLDRVAGQLLGAEHHHEREEAVLFPELEKRGLGRPVKIMRLEHEEFRERKEELHRLAARAENLDLEALKQRLDTTVRILTVTLRNHIVEESSLLYPLALQVIPEGEVWERMREEGERIGYCPFTSR